MKVRRESVKKRLRPANSAFLAAAGLFFGLFGKECALTVNPLGVIVVQRGEGSWQGDG
jgi:hypothetical protein